MGTRMHGLVLLACLWGAADAAAAGVYRFADGRYLGGAHVLPEWGAMLARNAEGQAALARCLADEGQCTGRLRGVRHLLLRAEELPLERQIKLINRYVNKRRYRDDRTVRKTSAISSKAAVFRSRWSTLAEFLQRGGDCEDFATSKYFLLRQLGVPSDDLRVVVIYDRFERDYHAVLAVRKPDGVSSWLLETDNMIVRGSGHRYVYALNEQAVWDHEPKDG